MFYSASTDKLLEVKTPNLKKIEARELDGKGIGLNTFTVDEEDHLFRKEVYFCPTISLWLCQSTLLQSLHCFTTLIRGALQHLIFTNESEIKEQCLSVQYSLDV